MGKDLRLLITATVTHADGRIPSGEVLRAVSRASGADKLVVRQTIKEMIAAGDLTYTSLGGTNFLESSFDRPTRFSDHIVVKPPNKQYMAEAGEVVINIAPGSAFGTGAHPTTRLMLRALDRLFHEGKSMLPSGRFSGLDIGTGSGILAIALASLGVSEVIATDVDPCAVWEARNNVKASGVEQQVEVTDGAFSELNREFSLVVANLAGPSLTELAPALDQSIATKGILMISGFRKDMTSSLTQTFDKRDLAPVSHTTLHDWACLVLKRKG